MTVHDCMAAVGRWMSHNCLKLNANKTEVVLFGNDPTFWNASWWPNNLGPIPTPTENVKSLGIYLDDKLSLKRQVNAVVSSVAYTLKICKKVLPYLPLDCKKTVILAVVISKLDYCNGLYLNIQEGLLHKLQLLQNAAARLLTGIPKHASISMEIKKLHWLPVRKRVHFKALCLVHRALHGKGPCYLKKLFTWYNPKRLLRSASARLILIPRIRRTNWGGRRFAVAAAKLWNLLPKHLRSISELSVFRKQLKTWLFTEQVSIISLVSLR